MHIKSAKEIKDILKWDFYISAVTIYHIPKISHPYFHWYSYQNTSLYALGRIRWILDIIWPLNQHFKLKNQRNWLKQVWMWKFWNVINCILLHWRKKLTLAENFSLNLVKFWSKNLPNFVYPILMLQNRSHTAVLIYF